MPRKYAWMLAPLLFTFYPIVFLYSRNTFEVSLVSILKPLALALTATVLACLAVRRIVRNDTRAAMFVTVLLIFFYSYGDAVNLATNVTIGVYCLGQTAIIFPVWVLLMMIALVGIARTGRSLAAVHTAMRWAGLGLILLSVLGIVWEFAAPAQGTDRKWNAFLDQCQQGWKSASAPVQGYRPSVYYFILDAYSGPVGLTRDYGWDNREFLDYLTRKGFYVARHATTNYTGTLCSVASSLNFEYLDTLAAEAKLPARSRQGILRMLGKTRVSEFLKSRGYKYVCVPSGRMVEWSYPTNADAILILNSLGLTEFAQALFDRTMLRATHARRHVGQGRRALRLAPA